MAKEPAILQAADYRHYVDTFHEQELAATGKLYEGEGGEDTWTWMQREIPWFKALPVRTLQKRSYCFRWYAKLEEALMVKTPPDYLFTRSGCPSPK